MAGSQLRSSGAGGSHMAAMPQPVGNPRIVRDPQVCGGEPTIKGTRIPVRCIVVEYQRHQDLEWVRQGYPRLDAVSLRDALEFYETNREEIDCLIAENEDEGEVAD